MRRFSNPDLLHLWERGVRLHPLDQNLLALAMALPETSHENLADWPIGRRNRWLAELRCVCFGPRLEAWTQCPRCGDKLEFELDCRTLAQGGEDENRRETVAVNGHSFRVPTSRDLASVADEHNSETAAKRLAEQCRIEGDEPPSGDAPDWSVEQLEEIGEQMALADPLAETRLTMKCPACEVEWEETLDIGDLLWTEIEARSKQLLFETHLLASAYGWSEREILSLSEPRRTAYLEMVQR